MLQTLNCIRMGEVLLDENLQLFILCNNCHTDLQNEKDFRAHLEKCEGLENLFTDGQQFKYNSDKSTQLFGKTKKGIKEFLIYNYNDVEISYLKPDDNFIDLINIEEELLDPKWYSDLNTEVCSNTSNQKSTKQYDELVEAVTPFVQFKENVKSNNNSSSSSSSGKSNLSKTCAAETKTFVAKMPEKSMKNVKFDLSAEITKPVAKRRLTMPKSVHLAPAPQGNVATISTTSLNSINTIQVNKSYATKKRRTETIINGSSKPLEVHQIPIQTSSNNKPKVNNRPAIGSIITTNVINPLAPKTTIIPTTTATIVTTTTTIEPTKEKQTAQILNKLQNLGLQVKRTQPLPPPIAPASAANKTDTKTLEILQKLQSKGMKVKILNKQQTMAKQLPPALIASQPADKPTSVIRNPAANMAIKQNLNKNLIIRKVI